MEKLPSYPTIQRKVRAINLTLGTKYSAKDVLERERAARDLGYSTKDWQIISQFKGVRADVKSSATRSQTAGVSGFFSTFNGLSRVSDYVAAAITPGEKYYSGIVIYTKTGDQIVATYPSGKSVQVNALPPGAQPLDSQKAYDLVKDYSKKVRAKNKKQIGSGYNDADYDFE